MKNLLALRLASLALVTVATCVAYSNSLDGPFLFDDIPRIVNDSRIRTLWPPWPILNSSNRPLAHYTFAINYSFSKYEVFSYHLANLVIHVLAAATLLGIMRRSWLLVHPERRAQALGLATTVALLWALHPLNTQSVSYIVQRLEAMMGLFYLLTLYCFVRAQDSRHSWLWYACSITCCAIGMGCKEVMVTAPVVVWWYGRVFVNRRVKSPLAITVALTACWGVLAWAMLHYQADYRGGGLLSVRGLDPGTYLTNQAAVITHYLKLAVWPSDQCAYYAWLVQHDLTPLAPYIAFMVALVASSLWLCYAQPKIGWLAISFFLILAPTSSIVPIVDLAFEHRMYLPLAAFVTLVSVAAGRMLGVLSSTSPSKPQQALVAAFVLGISLTLGLATYARNQVYSSAEAFWNDVTIKAPHNFNAWIALSNAYAEQAKHEEAEQCVEKAFEIAPDRARPQATYAGLLIARGQFDQAAALLQQALEAEPNLPEAIINQGMLLSLTGKFAEAQPYLEAGVRAQPADEELQTNFIANLCYLQQFDQARQLAEANQQLRPTSARAHNDLAACLLATGDAAGAEDLARQAIQLDPNLARAHATLGMAISKRSTNQAIPHLEQACRLDPKSVEFLSALGTLKMPTDQAGAIEIYRQALSLRPTDVELMLRLAMAYDATGQPQAAVPFLEQALRQKPDLHPVRNYLRSLKFRLRQK